MDWHPPKKTSSQIAAICREGNLTCIRFKRGRHGEADHEAYYEYRNLPEYHDPENPETPSHEAFINAESQGSYFQKRIKPHKDRFPYSRIETKHKAV